MVGLVDLPIEILIKIFSLLPRSNLSDLTNLIGLSKLLRPIAEINAYRSIPLHSHQLIRSLCSTLRSRPDLSNHIHHLTLISTPCGQTCSNGNHDESMIFFAFTALLRFTHHLIHLELELEGSNIFELTQLFQAISNSRAAHSIQSLVYLTRAFSSPSTQPDLAQLIWSLTSLNSLSIIGCTRYSNLVHQPPPPPPHPHDSHSSHHPHPHPHPHPHHHHHSPHNHLISIKSKRPLMIQSKSLYSSSLSISPPPIKSLVLSSSRLSSSSETNIKNLITICSKTLVELTLNETTGIRFSTLFEWAQPIRDSLETLNLIGNFCDGRLDQYDLVSLTPDWSLFVSEFRNLKSLKLINNFDWIIAIPVPISFNFNPPPPPSSTSSESESSTISSLSSSPSSSHHHHSHSIPIPSSNSTTQNIENGPSISLSAPGSSTMVISNDVISLSDLAGLNPSIIPTHYLEFKSLELLPKSIVKLTVETNKHLNQSDYYPRRFIVTQTDEDPVNSSSPLPSSQSSLVSPVEPIQTDATVKWKVSKIWETLENLNDFILDGEKLIRPSN